MKTHDKYEAVIGLEVHVQLLTQSKIFSSESASFTTDPNTQISQITLGHPGTLPKLNEKVIEYAVMLGLACDCGITKVNQFERKNYFYPDLPKGYQISQFSTPVCTEGFVKISVEDLARNIKLNRIHIEEDAGKSIHDIDPDFSCIDLNRAGIPLLELVTEPDIHTPDEAYEFLTELRRLVRYLEICDGNMEEGSLRCDANISVRLKGESKLGDKVEVKNLNSIRNVKRAITFEIDRQISVLERGEKIEQSTRSFDAANGTTFQMRTKEMAHDYRYFPEPDLPPFIVTAESIDQIKRKMPALPKELAQKFIREYGLSEYDSQVLTDEKSLALYFMDLANITGNAKAAANWMMGPVKSYLNEHSIDISNFNLSPETMAELISLIDEGKVSYSAATQRIFPRLIEQPATPPETIAKELNLMQQSDITVVDDYVKKVLSSYPDKVLEYKNGKKGVIGLFMGEIMKMSKGSVDPKVANKLLTQELNKN